MPIVWLTRGKKGGQTFCQLDWPQPTLDKNSLCSDSTAFLATLKERSLIRHDLVTPYRILNKTDMYSVSVSGSWLHCDNIEKYFLSADI